MISLEHIQDGDWAAVNRVIDRLMSLVLDTGGQSIGIRVGATTLTWPAAAVASNSQTINHGLGRTPIAVGAWGSDSTTAQFFYCYPANIGATQFTIRGICAAAPGAQTKTATWVAIG